MTDQDDHAERRPLAPLLDATDAWLIVALTALGMALRCAYFSGYGLGDDIIMRHAMSWFLDTGNPPGVNYAYRFVWWIPTAITSRLFGVSEMGLLVPILVAAAASFPVIYALGKALWGRPGAVVATALLIVMPLDFAWSTMLTPDIVSSTLSGALMACLLRAAVWRTTRSRRTLLALAALFAWLAFHVKISVGLLGVPILAIFWLHRRAYGRDVMMFFATAALLFGMTAYVGFAVTGDPLQPYTAEVTAQGLTGAIAAEWHTLSRSVMLHFPKAVFTTDQHGNALFGGYAPLILLLALTAPLTRLRSRAPEVWWWLVALALGLEFNVQRAEGEWVAGFRNVRHLHGIVHPLVLLLTGYLISLRGRSRRAFATTLVAVLAFGLWHSIGTATLTHESFADRRAACTFLMGVERKPVWSDFQIETWCAILPDGVELRVEKVDSLPNPKRVRQIAAIPRGYLVTGGGREPHYGCIDCIPFAREIDPTDWRLLFERPGLATPTGWRPEPLRIWERIETRPER